MPKLSKQQVTLFIVIGCIAAIVTGQTLLERYRSNIKPSSIPAKAKGNPEAKLKIVEYIDFECPACANGVGILNEYFKKHPNEIYVEVKYFPLSGHRWGMPSARYAECAARQDKFWPFVDILLGRQSFWTSLHDPIPAFREFAQQSGLSMMKLDMCLGDKYVDETIATEKTIGTSLGIQSTPTYFINDKMGVGPKFLQSELSAFFGEQVVQPPASTERK
jgi:protein-disulfide isomerase